MRCSWRQLHAVASSLLPLELVTLYRAPCRVPTHLEQRTQQLCIHAQQLAAIPAIAAVQGCDCSLDQGGHQVPRQQATAGRAPLQQAQKGSAQVQLQPAATAGHALCAAGASGQVQDLRQGTAAQQGAPSSNQEHDLGQGRCGSESAARSLRSCYAAVKITTV